MNVLSLYLVSSCSHSLLAVARSDSSVEIWSTLHTPVLQFVIHPPPASEDVSVESLAWAGGRLFSCGLHGQVVEYDLDKRSEAKRYPVTSGPAWCLAVDRSCSRLAVGTEDGFVCLFSISEEGLEDEKVLDRQEGRILCVSWHPDNVHIATGSTDTVRLWNIETGHPTARMVTGRSERNKETIVWCVAVTSDMTVISGDSRGKTSFWNGRTGTLMDSIQSHKADVLTLTLSAGEATAYSTGVDPTLMHFQTVIKNDGRRKWVKSLHRVISSHDVRAVVATDRMMFSGGVDTYLTVHNYPAHRTTVKIPAMPPASTGVKLAREARALLLTYSTSLQLWRLGRSSHTTGAIGSVLPLDGGEPVKLAEIGVKQGETVTCSAVHTSGEYLAYSTNARLRLLRVSTDSKRPERLCVPDSEPCHHLCLWTGSDGVRLMTLSSAGLSVFSISDEDTVSLTQTLSLADLGLSRGIGRVDHNNDTMILADNTDTVVSLNLDTLAIISRFPGYTEATISSMGLSPDSKTCFMSYSNNKVVEVDVRSGKFTKFSREEAVKLPKNWLSRRTPVTNIVHIENNDDLILMNDHNVLAVLDKDKEMPEPSSKLFFTDPRATPDTDTCSVSSFGSQLTSGSKMEQSLSAGLRMSRKFDHLVSLHHLDKDEVVAVEVKPSTIEGQLPPSLKQKKFGAS